MLDSAAGDLNAFEGLYVAVVSDVLDSLGLRAQTASPGLLRLGSPSRLIGRAFTLDVAAVSDVPEQLYETQFRAIDSLRFGDVVVVATPDGVASAFWGELITTRATERGALGALIDGYTRDVDAIHDYGFALWARGTHPADSAGRLDATSFQEPIEWAGVLVEPGDIMMADADGVVAVPRAWAGEVAELARRKADAENLVREELRSGSSAAEVFARHGVM